MMNLRCLTLTLLNSLVYYKLSVSNWYLCNILFKKIDFGATRLFDYK